MFHIPPISLKTKPSSWHSPHLPLGSGRAGGKNCSMVTSRFGHALSPCIQLYNIPCSSLDLYNFHHFGTDICVSQAGWFFFLSHISCPDTGCCLLTLAGCQQPKHMLMPGMSGSLERSDSQAAPINFLPSEAQKQRQQKTFSSAAVRKKPAKLPKQGRDGAAQKKGEGE